MAHYPEYNETQLKGMPGMHGEKFTANIPGYRAGEERINRTNNRLSIGPHEALNQKYLMDDRLKVLFAYGWAVGYNKMVMTKGRIVSADPYRDKIDWTSDKQFNILTLANGGVPVKVREASDLYPASGPAVNPLVYGQPAFCRDIEWAPVIGIDEAYKDGYFNALKDGAAKQMENAGLTVDTDSLGDHGTGKLKKDGEITDNYRPANKPLGMIERNEYTRFNDDSMDGMIAGPIITDAIVELPYFAFKDKAESNPWGSVYGNINVGDLVKSDENGRIVPSPLNVDELLEDMTPAQIERERQQVIGQIISVNHDMVPEGGYKWATWALADRLRYEGFAPDLYTQTNRPGEDTVDSSVYKSTGRYPGYPYDAAYTEHDLHMLNSGARGDNYDKFMNPEWQYEHLGIPGLTDGYNVAMRDLENTNAAVIHPRLDTDGEYLQQNIKIDMHGNVEPNDTMVQLVKVVTSGATTTSTNLLVGEPGADSNGYLPIAETTNKPQALGSTGFQVSYFNAIQSMLQITAGDPVAADTTLAGASGEKVKIVVNVKYKKRGGMAGVPTFMDWDGCVGSTKVLLQR